VGSSRWPRSNFRCWQARKRRGGSPCGAAPGGVDVAWSIDAGVIRRAHAKSGWVGAFYCLTAIATRFSGFSARFAADRADDSGSHALRKRHCDGGARFRGYSHRGKGCRGPMLAEAPATRIMGYTRHRRDVVRLWFGQGQTDEPGWDAFPRRRRYEPAKTARSGAMGRFSARATGAFVNVEACEGPVIDCGRVVEWKIFERRTIPTVSIVKNRMGLGPDVLCEACLAVRGRNYS